MEREQNSLKVKEFTVLYLFCGIGGMTLGFQRATESYGGIQGRFKTIAGIDVDPLACQDFKYLTGTKVVCMDLFERRDYIDFHDQEPGPGWKEATPETIREICGGVRPDIVVLTPPCKGLSALLPKKKSDSKKYQALNRLVVRGIFLTIEAFPEDPVPVFLLENVPRITTRGKALLHTVKGMLRSYEYEINEETHDCGELGGLAQHRKRYLLIARNRQKLPNFVYKPVKQRVRVIGEVIGPLPMPDDPRGGPMHKCPRLQWKTWVRLALIEKDWRDLERIAPEQYWLEYIPRGGGSFGVQDWNEPASTVTGNAKVNGSNAANIADPRLGHHPREGVYRVQKFDDPSTTVTGSAKVGRSNGATCIADPRLSERENRHPGVYRVVKFDEPGPCVTGTRFGSGAIAISDPRTGFKENTHTAIYQVNQWDEEASTVTGALRPNNGAISIADPRLKCKPRAGTLGVQKWNEPGKTVIGAGDIHAGASAVADSRIPKDNEVLDPPPVIISLKGTWNRPLTTWELLALQGFPLWINGKPLKLAGNSDARWREAIGNAVPPPAAQAMGEVILRALLVAPRDEWEFGREIWVAPKMDWEEIRTEVI